MNIYKSKISINIINLYLFFLLSEFDKELNVVVKLIETFLSAKENLFLFFIYDF